MKIIYLVSALGFTAHAQASGSAGPASQACAKLMNQKVSKDVIALPTNGAVIQIAEVKGPREQKINPNHRPAFGLPLTYGVEPALPQYCEVRGFIASIDPAAPPINFQINLPIQWNNKALHYGGGGMNGSVITGLEARFPEPPLEPVPLMRGYVTFGSDSGHCCGGNASFALNDEALRNFGHEQLKKTRDVAMAVVRMHYGRLPQYTYFVGNSQGGREALTVAQRYGADYNGVIATGPVVYFTELGLKQNYIRTQLARGGWMNKTEIDALGKSTLAACDRLDGIADGIVGQYLKCRHDVASLRCPDGADAGDTCLSDAQLEAVRAIREPLKFPFPLANDVTEYPGYALGGEHEFNQWEGWMVGRAAPTIPTPAGNERAPGTSTIPHYGASYVRYTLAQDPNFEPLDFESKMAQYRDRLLYVTEQTSSGNPDLSAFQAAGGKLILKTNTSDYATSARAQMMYYDSVVKKMGQSTVDKFMRFYVAPGAGHFGGYAPDTVDMITVLENWVEKRQEPGALIATEFDVVGTKVVRTRPLCRYPEYPKYNGKGDANAAESFTCAKQ